MTFRTPALDKFLRELVAEFPDIRFGLYNRRKISGSISWSQHSWPNAADLFFTRYGDTSPEHQYRLDRVNLWIRRNYNRLDVRFRLWRVRSHYDHIHVDFWPKGYSTPSTTRGGSDNRYMTREGRVLTQAELVGEEEDMTEIVKALQQSLLDAGFNIGSSGVDGVWGPDSQAALTAALTAAKRGGAARRLLSRVKNVLS